MLGSSSSCVCSFRSAASDAEGVKNLPYDAVLALSKAVHEEGLEIIKTENLCLFKNPDGTITPGFSLGREST